MTAEPAPMPYVDRVAALLAAQDGVVGRAQLVAADCAPHDVERMLRRKELFVALPGVYITHNGPRTWQQRAWVAVLSCWPAALAGSSALRAESGPGLRGFDEGAAIEVAVDVGRTVRDKPDVNVRRMAGMTARSRWNTSPPRVRYEEAVLDVVTGLTREWDVIEALAAAVRGRCTTAERLRRALARGAAPVPAPVVAGSRPDRCRGGHGIGGGGRIYRDAPYPAYDLDVELDGRVDHSALTDRDRDLERDLATATSGRRSVRLGWGQVYDRPCRTAAHLARLLASGGWEGVPAACSPTCPVGND